MGVSQPMVVVEDHDGGDHARGHHEHDAVEVCACRLHLSIDKEWLWVGKCKKNSWAAIFFYRERESLVNSFIKALDITRIEKIWRKMKIY